MDRERKSSEFTSWFSEFVAEYREKMRSLSPKVLSSPFFEFNLSPPIQVSVLWIDKPLRQFVFVTRFADLPDLDIKVFGPIPVTKILDGMEQIMNRPGVSGRRIGEHSKSYEHMLEHTMWELFDELTLELYGVKKFKPSIVPELHGIYFPQGFGFEWTIRGNITEANPRKLARAIFSTISKRNFPSLLADERETKKWLKRYHSKERFYGVLWSPAMWIEGFRQYSLKERLLAEREIGAIEVAARVRYREKELLIAANGLLVIKGHDERDVLPIANEVFATAVLLGMPAMLAQEKDVRGVRMTKNGMRITGGYQYRKIPREVLDTYRRISKSTMEGVIRCSSQLATNPVASRYLLAFLEGYSLHTGEEFLQSFMMGFLIVERYITSKWEAYLDRQGVVGNRREKMTSSIFWTLDAVLEVLRTAGEIQEKEYVTVMNLKKRRNKVAHEGSPINEAESKECLEAARSIIQSELGIFPRYQRLMKAISLELKMR